MPLESSDDHISELVSAQVHADELGVDGALRPSDFSEFVGQSRVKEQLSVMLGAARSRGAAADHVLLSGPPGLGKTTLAMIIAQEMNAPIRITSGPAIQRSADLASILSSLAPGEILFLDEIHRMARPAEEMLYLAMEDFRVDIVVGKGAGATAIPLDLPRFTLVGATTRAGLLPGPLRDRFGLISQLDFYDDGDLSSIIERSANLLEIEIDVDAIAEIGRRSRGTPRIANRLLRRVRDYSQVHSPTNGRPISRQTTAAALEMYEVDKLGLDRLDRNLLHTLVSKFAGGPVGLSTLALSISEEPETIEAVAEPFLIRQGFLVRTPRGRVATAAGWNHVGLTPPASVTTEFPSLFDTPDSDA